MKIDREAFTPLLTYEGRKWVRSQMGKDNLWQVAERGFMDEEGIVFCDLVALELLAQKLVKATFNELQAKLPGLVMATINELQSKLPVPSLESAPATEKPVSLVIPGLMDEIQRSRAEDREHVMFPQGPDCLNCGHRTVRNGACYRCLNCGASVGCS